MLLSQRPLSFYCYFLPKIPSSTPDCLKQTPTHPATPYNIPQHSHNVQTKSQAQEDGHHPERIFYETGIEELVDERWTEGLFTSILPLLTPPLGPFNDKDTDSLHAIIVQAFPRTRKSRFSTFPDKPAHLLSVHLGDQTLPSPMDDRAATPCHSPSLSHCIFGGIVQSRWSPLSSTLSDS